MEPICGQAHGARNVSLLSRTLVMATLMLLAASVLIALLWVRVDVVLLRFGQQPDITTTARTYVLCLPIVTSSLNPLKAYLSLQEVTLPTLFAAALGLTLHIPLTICLSARMGIRGVAASVWLSDLAVAATPDCQVKKTKPDNFTPCIVEKQMIVFVLNMRVKYLGL